MKKVDKEKRMAKVLEAVKGGCCHIMEISDETKISRFFVEKFLNELIAEEKVRMEMQEAFVGVAPRLMPTYFFVHDDNNFIEKTLEENQSLKSTPYLQKMFGYTDIKPGKGRQFNQKSITDIMRQKQITRWNPAIRKSKKNYVKGASLLMV